MASSIINFKGIKYRVSNDIEVAITANGKGQVGFTFSESIPTNATLISREFVRVDEGGWGVTVYVNQNQVGNYICYESIGSAPTLKGYVREVYYI